MSAGQLFSPYRLGRVALANRVVMAPLTRNRAIGNVPNALMARYYADRASAGLIITEGTAPAADGLGYARMPGLFDAAQVAGWRQVTDAVHAAGGRIFVQLMHTGRASHRDNLPAGAQVLAPSAVPLADSLWVDGQGRVPATPPAAMTPAQIDQALAQYARAAELAIEAGFDGVELHGANGYLIEQFLNTASNRRSDDWGGSVERRIRFAVEAARRAAERIGADRVGMRLSPYGAAGGMVADAETDLLYGALASELGALGLVYLHLVDHSSMGAPRPSAEVKDLIRNSFEGTCILSGGFDAARAEAALQAGLGELVAFGRPFISNPDLVDKLRRGAALTPWDPATFYTPGEHGYTDYPR